MTCQFNLSCSVMSRRQLTDARCRQHRRQHQRTKVRRREDFSEHSSRWRRKSSDCHSHRRSTYHQYEYCRLYRFL